MSEEIRMYPDGRKEVVELGDREIKAADLVMPIEAKAMKMIIKAKEQRCNVDGWVFVCHPSFEFAKLSEFMGHKVKPMAECQKDTLYFMKEPNWMEEK